MKPSPQKTLIIYPRRGLFQLTFCQSCGYRFECEQCDTNLTTYRAGQKSLELICHQCQNYYNYPNQCPKCGSTEIMSRYGGIEDLQEKIAEHQPVFRFGEKKPAGTAQGAAIHLSTRLFDPAIEYNQYSTVLIARAENLNASPDYLVQEDTAKSITELLLNMNPDASLILDIPTGHTDIFSFLDTYTNTAHQHPATALTHHSDFLQEESHIRQQFKFPPHWNILLITSQEKKSDAAHHKITEFIKQLRGYNFENVSISSAYPARFFKRKNMYSYHVLIKYPKQYDQFPQLRGAVLQLSDLLRVQVRLNPRHVF